MQVTSLFHVAIKTPDLDATVKFYTEVLGMELAHRPNFGFPGAWLAQPGGVPIIHIYAGNAATGPDGKVRTSNKPGWYFKVGSTETSVPVSKPPTYPTQIGSKSNAKLQ